MRKLTLKQILFPLITVAFGILFLSGCGATGSNTTGVVAAGPNPTEGGGDTTPLPDTTVDPDNRIPDLTGSVVLALRDNVQYSDLSAVAGNITLPVVGDPRVLLKITNTRNEKINGNLRLAFEDKRGYWWTDVNSVKDSGSNTSTGLDIIFTDNLLTLRVTAIKTATNGDVLQSALLYRVRAANEDQCLPAACYMNWYGQRLELPLERCFQNQAALDTYLLNRLNACRSYMTSSSTNTAVKTLGTFSVKYTDIAVLPEGN